MTENHGVSHEQWLAQSWPPGAIFAGGCDASGAAFSRCLSENDPVHIAVEAWTTLNEAVAQLEAHGCGNQRLTWSFEAATLRIARRTDGSWAGVFSALAVSVASQQIIEDKLNEFLGNPVSRSITEQAVPA